MRDWLRNNLPVIKNLQIVLLLLAVLFPLAIGLHEIGHIIFSFSLLRPATFYAGGLFSAVVLTIGFLFVWQNTRPRFVVVWAFGSVILAQVVNGVVEGLYQPQYLALMQTLGNALSLNIAFNVGLLAGTLVVGYYISQGITRLGILDKAVGTWTRKRIFKKGFDEIEKQAFFEELISARITKARSEGRRKANMTRADRFRETMASVDRVGRAVEEALIGPRKD